MWNITFQSKFPSRSCRLKQEQAYVRDEFGKILDRERISSNEHLTRAILRERAATEEERQKAQRFVSSKNLCRSLGFLT